MADRPACNKLESSAPDDQTIRALRYVWNLEKNNDSAWSAAKLNGALALIPSREVAGASYVYETEDASDPIAYGYFIDMDTAAAVMDYARVTGHLTPKLILRHNAVAREFMEYRARLHGLARDRAIQIKEPVRA